MSTWTDDLLEPLVRALDAIPAPLAVVLLAFNPVGEVRVSVPVGVLVYGMGWAEAVVWSLAGNLLVAPAAHWLYPRLEALLRRWRRTEAVLEWVFARTRRKVSPRGERIEESAVFLSVALVVLPGAGAWTGALLMHLFGLPRRAAWPWFYAGVVAAVFLMALLVTTGRFAYSAA